MADAGDSVAIVTRTKDRPLLLARAIGSVLAQRHTNWLHVIVNDGGDPAPVEALVHDHAGGYAGRARVLHHPLSVGMEAASNAGIAASASRYIAIHDDDDTWHPDFLARALAAIAAHPIAECAGAIAWAERVNERIEGDRIIEVSRESYNGWMQRVELWRLLAANQFPPISFVFARAALDEVGGFDPALPVLGDWDFNVRFCARYEVALVPAHLAYYHHRVEASAGAYVNTVVGGAALHEQWRIWLINRWLRRDLATGRIGIGVLAALSSDLHVTMRGVQLPRRMLAALRRGVARTGLGQVRRWLTPR
jgi:glycosyltransferase involved in cell wall biosynthesis